MADSSLLVMTSQFANCEVIWTVGGAWRQVADRPMGPLSDDDVRELFGDDAFRRRDELLASGDAVYHPQIAPLIGRRIVAQVQESGWSIDVDTSMSSDGVLFRMSRGPEVAEVRISTADRWRLQLVAPHESRETSSVGDAEAWLLGLGPAAAEN